MKPALQPLERRDAHGLMMRRIKQLLFERPHGCSFWQIGRAVLPGGKPYDGLWAALVGLGGRGEIVRSTESIIESHPANSAYTPRGVTSYKLAPDVWLKMAREEQNAG